MLIRSSSSRITEEAAILRSLISPESVEFRTLGSTTSKKTNWVTPLTSSRKVQQIPKCNILKSISNMEGSQTPRTKTREVAAYLYQVSKSRKLRARSRRRAPRIQRTISCPIIQSLSQTSLSTTLEDQLCTCVRWWTTWPSRSPWRKYRLKMWSRIEIDIKLVRPRLCLRGKSIAIGERRIPRSLQNNLQGQALDTIPSDIMN